MHPGLVLRSILLLTLLLLAVGAFAAVVEPLGTNRQRTVSDAPPLEWVRTADGWERPASWRPPAPVAPALNPWVVASLIAMTAVAGLLAGSQPTTTARR